MKALDLSAPYFKRRLTTQTIRSLAGIRIRWSKVTLPRQEVPYVIIHDQWTKNYYHWITQALPRLLLAQQQYSGFMLLLPEDHDAEFHTASLHLLGVTEWITLKTTGTFYAIQNLVFPSHDITIGDYNDDLMRSLAAKLKPLSSPEDNARIFIRRASRESRKILNEEPVIGAFRSFGFQIVEFEQLSFQDQQHLCASATVIAGVHGAGLTNMVFMRPGASVLELTSRVDGEQYYYYTLSEALGHHYYYLLGKNDGSHQTIQESDLWIDLDQLNDTLTRLTNDNG